MFEVDTMQIEVVKYFSGWMGGWLQNTVTNTKLNFKWAKLKLG